MANARHASQTLIAFACDRELVRAIDEARKRLGDDRSTFIRRCCVAELRRTGVTAPDTWIVRPDQTRVQRYPVNGYPEHTPQGAALNESKTKPSK